MQVFLKHWHVEMLNAMHAALHVSATKIQAMVRMVQQRKRYRIVRQQAQDEASQVGGRVLQGYLGILVCVVFRVSFQRVLLSTRRLVHKRACRLLSTKYCLQVAQHCC